MRSPHFQACTLLHIVLNLFKLTSGGFENARFLTALGSLRIDDFWEAFDLPEELTGPEPLGGLQQQPQELQAKLAWIRTAMTAMEEPLV